MPTYTVMANVVDGDIQNVQTLAATFGELRTEIEGLDGELLDAYAVLGEFDFQFTVEAPDEETALKIAVAIERYGLDTETHQLVDIERFGTLVEDI